MSSVPTPSDSSQTSTRSLKPTSSEIQSRLNPDIREALAANPFPPIRADTLQATRASRYSQVNEADLSSAVTRRSLTVPGPEGAPEISLRIHRPADATGPLPCLYWMHGGGLVMGSSIQDDVRFDRWCVRHNFMAVSVEYRMAPETMYPGAIEDCYAGLRWLFAHAEELEVDVTNVGIGGASAGAGLAAALSLVARDRGGPTISSQLLIYPMLDDRMTTDSSAWEVPIWPPSSNQFGWTAYLGNAKGGPDVSPYAAPARATNLTGLPPAIILVGALDGFVDEDIRYAQQLNHAGVEVELHVYPGAPHGFDALLPGTDVARRCSADMNAWMSRKYAR
jgi:acetyl esterase/lipase